MIDPSRHGQNKGWLETIAGWIPGFSGYLEREERRESDYLARKWMADRLQQAKKGLDNTLRQLADAAKLDALPPWERVRSRLDGLINKIRSAERGYSGFFDYVKVTEDVLGQVYQADMTLVESVRGLAEALERQASDGPQAAIEMLAQVDKVESEFGKRAEILRGLSSS